MKKILLASNNAGKAERYRMLVAKGNIDVEIVLLSDIGIDVIDVVEDGKTLAENAEKKVRAYFGKTDLPILGNDTGLWLESEGFVDAPKRIAFGEKDETEITKEEKKELMQAFWRQKAKQQGGKVNGAWIDLFVLLHPDGTVLQAEARREIILTDTVFGESHPELPIRALYISKATGKPGVSHTEDEELKEMEPITDALRKLL